MWVITLAFLIVLATTFQSGPNQTLSDASDTMDFLLGQANLLPINAIFQTASVTSYCLTRTEKIIFKTWAGTDPGCTCNSGNNYKYFCSAERIGCVNLGDTPQTSFSVWKGVGFCVQRVTSYLEQTNGNCPKNMKTCATSCVGLDDLCPINSFVISNDSPTGDQVQLPLSTGEKMIYSTTGTGKPIVTWRASFFGEPCVTPSYNEAPKNGTPYFLDRENQQGCSSFGSYQAARTTDTQNLADFFDQNQVTREISDLPGYEDYLRANTAYFSTVQALSINREVSQCQNLQAGKSNQLVGQCNEVFSTLSPFAWVGFALMGLALIFFIIECVFLKKYGSYDRKVSIIRIVGIVILLVLELILIIGGAVTLAHKNNNFIPGVNYFKSLRDNSCFNDEQPQFVLMSFISLISDCAASTFTWTLVLLILASVFFGLLIIMLVLKLALRKYADEDQGSHYRIPTGLGNLENLVRGPRRDNLPPGFGNLELLVRSDGRD